MLFYSSESLGADNMLDPAGVFCGYFGVYTEPGQPRGDNLMAFVDTLSDFPSGFRESDKAFRGYNDVLILTKLFHGDTDA